MKRPEIEAKPNKPKQNMKKLLTIAILALAVVTGTVTVTVFTGNSARVAAEPVHN